MKKILVSVLAVLFLFAPVLALADSRVNKYDVGYCANLKGGLWMQLIDGTWANPNDKLNLCKIMPQLQSYGQSQFYNSAYQNGYNGVTSQLSAYNNGQYGVNNQGLANYSQTDFYTKCVLMQTIVVNEECNRYNYIFGNSSYGGYNSALDYARNGYIAMSNGSFGLSVSFPDGSDSSDNSSTWSKIGLVLLGGVLGHMLAS